MTDAVVVFVTAPSAEEAEKIALPLLSEKLAACVNITPSIRSLYRWQGKIEDDSEVLMIIKTRKSVLPELKKRVPELHSYTTPEIIALPVIDGSEGYLNWLALETERGVQ